MDRPRLHFTPHRGWVNDPLGLTFHDGRYHLFFQHVPDRTTWHSRQSWGHASSPDLLHWTEHPVALEPGHGDDGAWSGCVVVDDDGEARILYSAVHDPDWSRSEVRVARPAPGSERSWERWVKGEVVARVPDGLDVRHFRDPFVLRHDDAWAMLVGVALPGGGGAVLLRSEDLEIWRHDGVLASRLGADVDPVWTGSMWECPQLFRADGHWVLVISVWDDEITRHQAWAVGDLDGGRFVPSRWGRLAWGAPYAGVHFTDAEGRPGLLHWLRDVDGEGWAGAHSLPHRVRVVEGRVVLEPHPVVTAVRGPQLAPTADAALPADGAVDLEVELDGGAVVTGGLRVAADDGGVGVHLGEEVHALAGAGPRVRMVLDGPVAEVFTDAGLVAGTVPAHPGRVVRAEAGARVRGHVLR